MQPSPAGSANADPGSPVPSILEAVRAFRQLARAAPDVRERLRLYGEIVPLLEAAGRCVLRARRESRRAALADHRARLPATRRAIELAVHAGFNSRELTPLEMIVLQGMISENPPWLLSRGASS